MKPSTEPEPNTTGSLSLKAHMALAPVWPAMALTCSATAAWRCQTVNE
jgi:hypothetical protein